ncbi:MAG: nucleoside-diphosphate sugar epimerase/dehydratase [Aquisalimonadaceae bacterium]
MNLGDKLTGLPRRTKQLIMMGSDMLLLPIALWAAFALRLGTFTPAVLLDRHWWLLIAVPALTLPLLGKVGLYRAVVRYMSHQAVVAVVKGISLSVLVLVILVVLLRLEGVPRTTYFLYWMLGLLAIGGTRFTARAWFQAWLKEVRGHETVAIYGAGSAGVQLASSLLAGRGFVPRVFVDDNPSLHGSLVNGLPVHAPGQLPQLVRRYAISQVLLALPSASRARRRAIVGELQQLPVQIKTMPTLADIVAGHAKLDDVREVDIDDLLGRESVEVDPRLLDHCIKGLNVLVTGAGGSIGSELCRQILRRRPTVLVLIEQSEFALYRIEGELRAAAKLDHLEVNVVALLGSVTDEPRLEAVMRAFAIHTVYHAAAYKHVPIVEGNVIEGVHNNIFGTWFAARAAVACGVTSFVLVSTDKAVRPTNVMGATKRFAELVLQALAAEPGRVTTFSMVRFGNVLGSSGSVVPLFREQIHNGGPVTVTHPDITRYFMTIPEAAALVIQAGSMAEGGDVFVLDMGEPIRILDLARKMIQLSGFDIRDDNNPDGEIAIEFTDLRPGEKLFEELLLGDNVTGTAHPMIMRAEEECFTLAEIEVMLAELRAAGQALDSEGARVVLRNAVRGYQGADVSSDLLWSRLRQSLGRH